MSAWYEDDEFWHTLEPMMFRQEQIQAAEEEVAHVLTLTGMEPPVAVLDMCCGPGRHSLEFAGRGCDQHLSGALTYLTGRHHRSGIPEYARLSQDTSLRHPRPSVQVQHNEPGDSGFSGAFSVNRRVSAGS